MISRLWLRIQHNHKISFDIASFLSYGSDRDVWGQHFSSSSRSTPTTQKGSNIKTEGVLVSVTTRDWS